MGEISRDQTQTTDIHPADARYVPGSFGCHEALHMASVFYDMVEDHLCEHPSIQQNPEWRAKAAEAAQALFDLHQMIGAKHV